MPTARVSKLSRHCGFVCPLQLKHRLRLRGLEVVHGLLSLTSPLSCQRMVYRSLLTVLFSAGASPANGKPSTSSTSSKSDTTSAAAGDDKADFTADAPGDDSLLSSTVTQDSLLTVAGSYSPFANQPDRLQPTALQQAWQVIVADLVSHARGSLFQGQARGTLAHVPAHAFTDTTSLPALAGVESDLLPLLAVVPCLPSIHAAHGGGGGIPDAPPIPRSLFPPRSVSMSTRQHSRGQLDGLGSPLPLFMAPLTSHGAVDVKLALLVSLLQRLTVHHTTALHGRAEGATGEFLSPTAGRASSQLFSPAAGSVFPAQPASSPLMSPIAVAGGGGGGGDVGAVVAVDGVVDITTECRVVASSNSRNASRVLDHTRLLRDWISNVSHYDGAAPRCHLGT